MPAVTVVIPNYNHTRYLGEAIRSVLAQAYRDFEIVVVDDGSTDNCRAVVAGFGGQVRYVRQENQGLAAARNTGLRCARGELVGLLDADDQWLPDFLAKMTTLAARYPQTPAYYCGAQAMDETGQTLPQTFGTPARRPEQLYQELLRANFIIPSTVVLRRGAVHAAGLFDPTLRSCEDWDLWLRLLPAQPLVGLSDCLVRYRVHANTLSTRADSMQTAARAVIEKHFGIDDENEGAWTAAKHRAYGGLYRYHTLSCVQRKDDWAAAARHFARALNVDPTLAVDLDFFYDLALGSQPQGYRGTRHQLHLRENAASLHTMIRRAGSASTGRRRTVIRRAHATASFAGGLLAYNTGDLSFSFRSLLRALYLQPTLIHDLRVVSTLVKCPVGLSILGRLKRAKARLMQAPA